MTGASSAIGGTTLDVPLQAVIDALRRLDELSMAKIVGEAAEAVHKAQSSGQPLGTLTPRAIVVSTTAVRLELPPAGTVGYAAPEQLRGSGGDRRSDVFSLGVVLWEALAHARLFEGNSDDEVKQAVLEQPFRPPSELNANVPAELDAICKKALARDPADRYQSAKVMAAEIAAVLDDAGYPDGHEEIAKYLEAEFPEGVRGEAPKDALKQTILGMAPLREPAPAPAPEAATPEAATPEEPKASDSPEQPKSTDSPEEPKASDSPEQPEAEQPEAEQPEAEQPEAEEPEASAEEPRPAAPRTAASQEEPTAAAPTSGRHKNKKKKKGKGHTKAGVGGDAKPTDAGKPSIATADTVETPALGPATIPGLPSTPPGATVAAESTPDASTTEAAAAVDPTDAVSLPHPGADAGRDVLGGWGWSDDSQVALEHGAYEDDAPDDTRKRLILAIGGALAVIVLVLVIALAAGGDSDARPDDAGAQAASYEGPSRTAPAPAEPATTPPVVAAPEVAAAPAEPAPTAPEVAAAAVEPANPEPAPTAPEVAAAAVEPAKPEPAPAPPVALAAAEPAKPVAKAAVTAQAAKPAAPAPVKKEPAKPAPAKKEPAKPQVAKRAAVQPEDPYAAPAAPKHDSAAAYKKGFQQYVRGDTAAALATFQRSLAADPRYPATWRGLGLAFEKLGRKTEAKKAFARYLQLAPGASDAAQIRGRMEKLTP